MAVQMNIHEAKSNLSKLVEKALAGEDVVIAKAGKPAVRLVRYEQPAGKRRLGLWEGKVRIAEDFDETPQELIDAFYGDGE